MNPVTAILVTWRTLRVRPRRTLILLLGYGLGVAVMIALLAVGDALLFQARDRDVVSGGDLVLLPAGIDPEALKISAVTGMFLAIPNARFLVRQVLLGPRYAEAIEAVSPEMTDKLIYVRTPRGLQPARASAALPSAADRSRSALAVPDPAWRDTVDDQAWLAPSSAAVLESIDRFHQPPPGPEGRSWTEWWYFNFTTTSGAYGYISFIADRAAKVDVGVVLRRPDGRLIRWHETYEATVLPFAGTTYQAGPHRIELKDAIYHIHLARRNFSAELQIRPMPYLYFPPVEWTSGAFRSGYVAPALRAAVTGVVRVGAETIPIEGIAYHDHNWGTWQAVTWEWGSASVQGFALLVGLVRHPALQSQEMRVTLYAADSGRAGLLSMLRAGPPTLSDWRVGPKRPGSPKLVGNPRLERAQSETRLRVPGRLRYRAANDAGDHLDVEVTVDDVVATPAGPVAFLQIWGRYKVEGRIGGRAVSFVTRGFAETFMRVPSPR